MRGFALGFVLLLAGIFCLGQQPRAQLTLTGAGCAVTCSAAPVTTTLDPANVGLGAALSNGNLTLSTSISNIGHYSSSRSIDSHSTGKYYYETTFGSTDGSTSNTAVGIVNASASLITYPGIDANGAAVFGASNGLLINGADSGTTVTWAQGDTAGVAIDFGAGLFWMRNTGTPGTWNAGGTANPATGVGGISISSMNAGPYFAVASINSGVGLDLTMNFGATSYAASAPSGFGYW